MILGEENLEEGDTRYLGEASYHEDRTVREEQRTMPELNFRQWASTRQEDGSIIFVL